MANITPLPRAQLEEFEPLFRQFEARSGFVPNSLFTMARRPEILRGFFALSGAVHGSGTVDLALKRLVALVASTAAGCRYCQAHTATFSAGLGVPADKVAAVWEFESDARFSDAERAALRLARDGAQVPNATTPAHFDALREHFAEGEIVELVATIAMFGFLNRWNDIMATELEAEPLGFAAEHLSGGGWEPGKHAAPR